MGPESHVYVCQSSEDCQSQSRLLLQTSRLEKRSQFRRIDSPQQSRTAFAGEARMKALCRVCNIYKRAYGKSICRGCYRIERAVKLVEYREKALRIVQDHSGVPKTG